MTEIKINPNTSIKVYNSIKEMPVALHNLAQRYLLQETGIGSDIQAIDEHFSVLDTLIASEKTEEAKAERMNIRYSFFMILEKLDFKSPAFVCHIHSVNNVPITDYSEDALKNLIETLSNEGLTMGMVEDQLFELKKNFNLN